MNRKLLSISLLLISVFYFSGCKDEETEDPGASSLSPGKSRISCTVTGAVSSAFKTNDLVSTVLRSSSLMNISGSAISGTATEIVLMILPVNITAGTYTSASNNSGDFAFSYSNGSTGWAADVSPVFTVVVTKATATEIEGTFSGVVTNDDKTQVTIKDGKFAAKY